MSVTRCSRPRPSRRVALGAAAFALLPPVIFATVAHAQGQSDPVSRAVLKSRTLDATVDVLDLRDAPVRQAIEMTMLAGHGQWSLENSAKGFVTLKSGEQPIRSAVDAICAASTVPLKYTVTNTVYFIGPSSPITGLPARTPPFLPASQPAPSTTPLKEISRRVAGIMIMNGGPSYAILETGGPYGTNSDVRVVTSGAYWSGQYSQHVPSGVAGIPDLTVTGIDATGVTLTTADGATIRVPLATRTF